MKKLTEKIILYLFIYSCIYFFYHIIIVNIFSLKGLIDIIWTLSYILVFLISIHTLISLLNIKMKENIMFCWTLALLYDPVTQSIFEKNLSILLLFLIVSGIYCIINKKEFTAGIIFGILPFIKPGFAVFLFFIILNKYYKSIFSYILTFVILTITYYTLEYFNIYHIEFLLYNDKNELFLNQTNQSLYHFMITIRPTVSKYIYFIPLLLVIPYFFFKNKNLLLQISFLTLVGLLISFIALESYYTLLLLPFLVTLLFIQKYYLNNNFIIILFFLSYVVISLSIGIDNPLLNEINYLRPFIFIKLYFAIVLYYIVLRIGFKTQTKN